MKGYSLFKLDRSHEKERDTKVDSSSVSSAKDRMVPQEMAPVNPLRQHVNNTDLRYKQINHVKCSLKKRQRYFMGC